MSMVGINSIVVDTNIRTFPGIDNIGKVALVDLPNDEQEEILVLAESIKVNGLLQPIVVRALKNDRYRLIAGWRRYMACCHLERTTIDVKTVKTKKEDESLIQLVENVHRKDLNPIDIATSLHDIRATKGFKKQETLATYVNKSTAWVSYHLSLLTKAIPELQEAISTGEIGIGGAREIMSLPKTQQEEALTAAKKEAKTSGNVDKVTGKPKVKMKGARRQARRRKKTEKSKQGMLPPVAEREKEQKEEMVASFFRDTQKDMPQSHKKLVDEFWDYLMDKSRLHIK